MVKFSQKYILLSTNYLKIINVGKKCQYAHRRIWYCSFKTAIVDKLSKDTFIADIGDSPEDWDTITITIDDIEKVVYRNNKSIDGW